MLRLARHAGIDILTLRAFLTGRHGAAWSGSRAGIQARAD
jgi:hypothetical protein